MNKKVILLIVSLLSPMHSLSINNENHINITKNDLNLVKNICIDFMKTVKDTDVKDTELYLIDILHSNTYIYKETKVNKFLSEIDGNETEFGPYPLSMFENRENISLLYNLRSQHKYDYYFKSDTFMIIGLNNINYINHFKSIFESKILQNKLNL
jgi:hypothetical protein